MAWEIPGVLATFRAGHDLSQPSHQYRVVTIVHGFRVMLANQYVRPIGVLQDTGADGQPVSVMLYGITKLRVKGTVDVGMPLTVDSEGYGIQATQQGQLIFGIALESAPPPGDGIITAAIFPAAAKLTF